jgi:ribosomal protein L11 methyltransferase
LQALEQLADVGVTPARLLDYGCGTGLLAMGAALLWPAASVTAADNDARAVEIAIENVETNGLGGRIQLYRTDLPSDPAIAAHGLFDLIVANILAEPLIAMAQPLAGQLCAGRAVDSVGHFNQLGGSGGGGLSGGRPSAAANNR